MTNIMKYITLIGVIAGLSVPAQADNHCKAKDDKSCQESSECYWVKGYTNAKSEMVKGHCRAKPSKPTK